MSDIGEIILSKSKVQKLKKRITDLEEEVKEHYKNREELNAIVIEKAKQRNELNQQVRDKLDEANKAKQERNDLNEKVQELKQQKNEYRERVGELRGQLRELREKTRKKTKESGEKKLNPSSIRKRIKKLEWELQTTPASDMSIEDERSLVDRITDLEKDLGKTQKEGSDWDKKRKLNQELREYRQRMNRVASEMHNYVKRSREKHKQMIDAYKEANKTRKEADTIHQNIQEIKSEADKYHQEYIESLKAKRKVKRKLKKKQKEKYVDISKIPVRQLKEQAGEAEDKVKDGKKISFNEFRSLIDQGMI